MKLGDQIKDTLTGWIEGVIKNLINTFKPSIVTDMKTEIALHSIDPEIFTVPEIKDQIIKLKESWKHSPESISDIARDIINIIIGKASQTQLEHISGVIITDDTPISKKLFTQIAVITDITLFSNIVSIVGSAIPFTQLQDIGRELRSYLDYSGLSQISGYGYGMILGNVLGDTVKQELNAKIQKALPDPQTLLTLWWRKWIDDDEFHDLMHKLGFSNHNINHLINASRFYPSPRDFIEFAVRDTFKPDVVSKYGYDNDYPTDIDRAVEKAGMSSDWLKHYWRAHWQLPSITQAYDMLHRGIITKTEVQDLLRINDIAPYWIPKIMQAAYQPYTRVDIRRMYDAGVLNEAQVKRAYLDDGYDDEHATNLTTWTIGQKTEVNKDLTLTMVKDAYKAKQITKGDTTSYLHELGYDDFESGFLISLWDYQNSQSLLKRKKTLYTRQYVKGLITYAELKTKFQNLGLKTLEIEESLDLADDSKKVSVKIPSMGDLKTWVKKGIINDATFINRAKNLGYSASDANLYLQEAHSD